jgi:hypothetical protein
MKYKPFSTNRLKKTGRTRINPVNELRRIMKNSPEGEKSIWLKQLRNKKRSMRKFKKMLKGMSIKTFAKLIQSMSGE